MSIGEDRGGSRRLSRLPSVDAPGEGKKYSAANNQLRREMDEIKKLAPRIIDQRAVGIKLRNVCKKVRGVITHRKDRVHGRTVDMARYEFLAANYREMSKSEAREFFLMRCEWLEVCSSWRGGCDFVMSLINVPEVPHEAVGLAAMFAFAICGPDWDRAKSFWRMFEQWKSMPADDVVKIVKDPQFERLCHPKELSDKILLGYGDLDKKTASEIVIELDLYGLDVPRELIGYALDKGRVDVLRAIEKRYGDAVLDRLVITLMAGTVLMAGRGFSSSFPEVNIEVIWSELEYFEERYSGVIVDFIMKGVA